MSTIQGKSVLVIEDENAICLLIEDMISDFGVNAVYFASSIEDGLSQLSISNPDIVLLDQNLGGTLSIGIVDVLIKKEIPFVVQTGYPLNICKGDAAPILQKPFSQADLRRSMEMALKQRSKEAAG